MMQATPLTSPRLPIVLLALPFALFPWPASTAEIESVYTPLDLSQCKDVTPEDVKEYGTVWRCPGHDGIDVRVAEGDLRIFVSYGPKAETQTAAYETVPEFNTIGDKLEWRVAEEGGQWKLFATILRFTWSVDDKKGATLVVTKLGTDDSCHIAYVEASGNPRANDQARAIADKDARGFICKKDRAKHYGADGN
ncbi:MAG: hypothetical protein WED13_09910 [Methyloceanibacter sp.]